MTSRHVRRQAQARGVATSYRDWRGQRVEVGDDTLRAVLDALGPVAAWPRPPKPARYPLAPAPARRNWGFTVQLYSLRSRGSWGHGDFADLAALAAWSGRELGAGFVLTNPLHAAEPVPPVSPSPYLPMSRRFISPLYLRVEDIPEYTCLPAEQRQRINDLAAPLRARNATPDLIDRDAVWHAKRSALTAVHAQPLAAGRQAAFERFLVAQGQALQDWAVWCALAEVHGPDCRAWPGPLRRAGSAAVDQERHRLAAPARFHAWLQWVADGQRAAAQATARAAGMDIGVIGDLAVGSHPGGADFWAQADVTVPGMSLGAPPDEFNQRGQDWAQVPWHPGRLAATGYRPLVELIRAALRHSGGLRADHVMGFFRLWWVPAGMPASQGTYVRYPHDATVGVFTSEAARAGALAIGEDLGTVEPWVHDYLAARQVIGTSMLWFERRADGSPLPPPQWRRACLATVGTHDVPPAAAFFAGEQVTFRAALGMLTNPVEEEEARARTMVAGWCAALVKEGLLRPGQAPGPAEFTTALYGYLARTPSALVGVSLADVVGERRPQNMPGTTDEYPNWRVPLCDGEGRPLLIEDLAANPGVLAAVSAVAPVAGQYTRA